MRTVFVILMALCSCTLMAQKEGQLFLTATDNNDGAVEQLNPSDLSGPDQFVISKVARLGASPIGFAVLLDISGSRRAVFDRQNQLADIILRQVVRNGQDRGIVVSFNEEPFLDVKLTTDTAALEAVVGKHKPAGGSAIFDAVDAAAKFLKDAVPQSPAVIFLISDGDDNASRWGETEGNDFLHHVGVRVYTFYLTTAENRRGRRILNRLAEESGGREFDIPTGSNMISVATECHLIRADLDNWYLLTYSSGKMKKPVQIRSNSPQVTIRAPMLSLR